jgi:hypothetical protein
MPRTTKVKFDRDRLAKWYAKRHFDTDSGVVKIFHLPKNAGPREIRFLEVNKLISETTLPEPIDFGVDVDGADAHTLYVLDVTPSQWNEVQAGRMSLPGGWTLDGKQELGRRSARRNPL